MRAVEDDMERQRSGPSWATMSVPVKRRRRAAAEPPIWWQVMVLFQSVQENSRSTFGMRRWAQHLRATVARGKAKALRDPEVRRAIEFFCTPDPMDDLG